MKMWLGWVVATAVAFGVGGPLGTDLSPTRDIIVIGYFALSISLILAGALQWLMLRRLVDNSGWWVPMSVAAVALVGMLVFGLGLYDRDLGWVLGVIVGWLVLGGLQWLVLREHVGGAGWWVLASALGLILAIPLVGLMTWVTGGPSDGPVWASLRWLAFGAAYGATTGTVLLWLLRERFQSATP